MKKARNKAIRDTVYFERLKESLLSVLDVKQVDKWLKANVYSLDIASLNHRQIQKLSEKIIKELTALNKEQITRFKAKLEGLFEDISKAEVKRLADDVTVKPSAPSITAFVGVLSSPLDFTSLKGITLEDIFSSYSTTEAKRIVGAIRLAHHQNKTNAEITRLIRGTKARNYQDGLLAISKRNADTIVRTSTAVILNESKAAVAKANSDLIEGIEVVATLDGRTSSICRQLDGEFMPLAKAKYPPYHYRCRSSFMYVLKEGFIKPSKRASKDGTVTNISYYEWLKQQDADFQNAVLGKKKADLFRQENMSVEKFKAMQFDKNFNPLTLKEMQEYFPSVFK